MERAKKPVSVVISAALAALPSVVLPAWWLTAAAVSKSGPDNLRAGTSVDSAGMRSWGIVLLVAVVPAGLLLGLGLLRGSRVARHIVRALSWATVVLCLFVSVYNIAHWRGDTGFLAVVALLLVPAAAMLHVTSRRSHRAWCSTSPGALPPT
jgi:hypothetical protein